MAGSHRRRLYLAIGERRARFLSFSETDKGDVLLFVHGLAGAQPTAALHLPDMELDAEGLRQERVWRAEQLTRLPGRPEHMTFHRDARFHLKLLGEPKPIYSEVLLSERPVVIGSNTARFLDLEVCSDRVDRYSSSVSDIADDDMALVATPASFLVIRAGFAGVDFPLSELMDRDCPRGRGFELAWPTFKAVFKAQAFELEPEEYAERPRGTLVRLRFHAPSGRHRVKELLFE